MKHLRDYINEQLQIEEGAYQRIKDKVLNGVEKLRFKIFGGKPLRLPQVVIDFGGTDEGLLSISGMRPIAKELSDYAHSRCKDINDYTTNDAVCLDAHFKDIDDARRLYVDLTDILKEFAKKNDLSIDESTHKFRTHSFDVCAMEVLDDGIRESASKFLVNQKRPEDSYDATVRKPSLPPEQCVYMYPEVSIWYR